MLKDTRPEFMGTTVLTDLVKRAGNLDPNLIDDVIIGCTFPEATQGLNLGRVLVMSMHWPDRIPGMTVNRFCSSGPCHRRRENHVRFFRGDRCRGR
jgi:acetyl-CoA acyltransferase